VSADVIFVGGRIFTLDPVHPRAEAVAVEGGRISAVGSTADVLSQRSARTDVVELRGRTLAPGFYDAHQHQLYAGLARRQVDGRAGGIAELLHRVRSAAAGAAPGSWIEGAGYDERVLAEGRPPTREELDGVAPGHPVLITRTCGHAMIVNSRGLAAAGVDRSTPEPPGGRIGRDRRTREPTGVLHERAMELVRRVVPQPGVDALEAAILDEAEANLRLGITSVWEPSVEPAHVEAYRRLDRDGRLPIRVTMAHKKVLRSGEEVPLPTPFRGPRLSLVAVKLFQDGAIGARTAAVSGGYAGDPENQGVLIWSQPELDTLVAEIHQSGLQVSVHAIGDRAIASALSAIESALASAPRDDHRHRIEHCGLAGGDLVSRIARSGVVPVLQPIFLHFHGDTYLANLTQSAAKTLYPVRSLVERCQAVAGSSDGPVVPDRNPLAGIRTAITRLTVEGRLAAPHEAVALETALALYTTGAAFAAHEETEKGSLSPGKLADLVVLDHDLNAVPPAALGDVGVDLVFVDGTLVVGTP